MPALIARVMPDGTTWWRWYQRNEWGRTTQLVERWIDPDGVEQRRTNTFYYASNGIDLVSMIGPDGTCLGGYAYEDPNHPRLPTAFTNALGEVTHFYYDSLGRLIGISYPPLPDETRHNVTNYYGSDGYLNTESISSTVPRFEPTATPGSTANSTPTPIREAGPAPSASMTWDKSYELIIPMEPTNSSVTPTEPGCCS